MLLLIRELMNVLITSVLHDNHVYTEHYSDIYCIHNYMFIMPLVYSFLIVLISTIVQSFFLQI